MAQSAPDAVPTSTRRLRFAAPDLEPAFIRYHFRQSLRFMRFAVLLAFVLYAAFGILDAFNVPHAARSIWVVRYAIVCPIALIVLLVTYTRGFEAIAQEVLSAFAIVAGLGIVAIVALAGVSVSSQYYAGLLLVIPWAYSVLRLRFGHATVATAIILTGYEIVAIAVQHVTPHVLINNNFFFVSSVIVGMVAGYTIERSMRTEFLQRRVIEAQRAELTERNVHLDSALSASLDELRVKADELQASRARLVAAADSERRRLERNLHDGAQQRLVALGAQLRLVERRSETDEAGARELLRSLEAEVQETIDELRALAHGIYPPLLMDQGLPVALDSAGHRSALPVTVEADGVGRYPPEIEAAIYFCCLEAIQNANKHAGSGATIAIRLRSRPGELTFEVSDNGRGFDADAKGLGAGFVNMSDRLGAVGGSVTVESSPGRGTCVSGRAPV